MGYFWLGCFGRFLVGAAMWAGSAIVIFCWSDLAQHLAARPGGFIAWPLGPGDAGGVLGHRAQPWAQQRHIVLEGVSGTAGSVLKN